MRIKVLMDHEWNSDTVAASFANSWSDSQIPMPTQLAFEHKKINKNNAVTAILRLGTVPAPNYPDKQQHHSQE